MAVYYSGRFEGMRHIFLGRLGAVHQFKKIIL
jgi:hypothetical protein